jgi:hypothetical protein
MKNVLSKSHAKSVCKPSILLYYLMSSHGICSKVRGDTRVQSQEQDQDQKPKKGLQAKKGSLDVFISEMAGLLLSKMWLSVFKNCACLAQQVMF